MAPEPLSLAHRHPQAWPIGQAGFAISIAALGMTLGTTSVTGEFTQSFALAAFVALLGMIAGLALLPAKSL